MMTLESMRQRMAKGREVGQSISRPMIAIEAGLGVAYLRKIADWTRMA